MTELAVTGCRSTPLGGYLSALGLLRVITRLLDAEATGHWRQHHFVLGSRFTTLDELVDELHARFQPEAIVSPWNAGSGFAGNGKSPAAEKAVQWVRDCDDPRLDRLREAVRAADRVIRIGHERGWKGQGSDLWYKTRKDNGEVLRLCRTEFPDTAVPWLDAAVALGQDGKPVYSRLLGTGANLGRQDLSATYLQLARRAFEDGASRSWLRAALDGREPVRLPKETLGQYDPGAVGSPEDPVALGNPWTFLLLIEGTLLFATAVARRHGAQESRAALPFQVHGSRAGFDSSAADERALAELWAPEWSVPTRLDEIAHLLGEGRAEWNGKPAGSGLDFVRAVATLGVDRGIDAFTRHVFVERLGQSPIAVPAGRIEVCERQAVTLLAGLDRWLEATGRTRLPGTVEARVRALEQALFTHARSGQSADLLDVFAALGRCHESVARSSSVQQAVAPLVLPHGEALLDELEPADATERVALALATARDPEPTPTLGGLRPLLSPVTAESRRRWVTWTSRPVPASLAVGLPSALAEAARQRGFPGAVDELEEDLVPAVRGVRIGFAHGLALRSGDVAALVDGALDEQRVADLLTGLLTVDWGGTRSALLPGGERGRDPALDLMLPFTGTRALRVPDADGNTMEILLRPGSRWPVLLAAGRITEVLDDAARRLRIAGLRHVIAPAGTTHDGKRLAAVLLLRVPDHDRAAALRRVAALPETPVPPNQEITA